MNIVVTGAAGFIGSHTVDLLLASGHCVIGIDNFRSGNELNIKTALRNPRFKFLHEDLSGALGLKALFDHKDIFAVIHLAGMASVAESIDDPASNFNLNVSMADQTIRAALRAGVKRLIFASSAAAYGMPFSLPLTEGTPCAPLSPYGAAKLAIEQLIGAYTHSFALEGISLRYFNVYGIRQNPRSEYSGVITQFLSKIAADEAITIYGDGRQTRDFVSVYDVAAINVAAATANVVRPGTYNICNGTGISINDLASELFVQMNKVSRINYSPARTADIRHSHGDPSRLYQQGWLNRFAPLGEGLQQMIKQR